VLLRRFSCVIIYLFSVISGPHYDERKIASSFREVGLHVDCNEEELLKQFVHFRDGGRRYIDISLRLGGMGVLWLLPLEAVPTVYAFCPPPIALSY